MEVQSWTDRHRRRIRQQIAEAVRPKASQNDRLQALVHFLEGNPHRGGPIIQFDTDRSQIGEFSLHDTLPLAVRAGWRKKDNAWIYPILCRLMDEMAHHLRSLSLQHARKVAALLHRLVLCVLDHSVPCETEIAWMRLTQVSGSEWLDHWASITRGKMSFPYFKRQMRYVQLLHSVVLQPGTKLPIPSPKAHGRVVKYGDPNEGAHGSHGGTKTSLHNRMAQLRKNFCIVPDRLREAKRKYAFHPTEVYRIVQEASTIEERLIVLLFLTTGLRIGGLVRIELPNEYGKYKTSLDVPSDLSTVEKNGRLRVIRLSAPVKMFLALWCQEKVTTELVPSKVYLFPGKRDPTRHVSTRHVWAICKAIFQRAGITGEHAHPHSFRHTVVQMLYMNGVSFEAIAKWIGHAHATVTTSVYGRLSHDDLQRGKDERLSSLPSHRVSCKTSGRKKQGNVTRGANLPNF